MSTINVNNIDKESGSNVSIGGSGTTVNIGASGQTTNVTGKLDASNADFVPKNPLSNRNLIINGAMQVAQRGTSFTGIGGSPGTYSCDRWRHGFTATTARCTLSRDTNAPNGFSNSFKVSITTAEASLNAASGCGISQPIEGQNLQMLAKGTADAKQVTVSFWVKTNKTGTYQFELQDLNNARNQVLSYTVNAADTWEYKTATFDGDTTGAFQNDAGASAYLQFFLFGGTNYTSGTVQSTWGSRSNANLMSPTMPNLADSTSNYWQITGIQLEVGSVATPFEHESFGQTLAKCQRYYTKSYNYNDAPGTNTQVGAIYMRGSSADSVSNKTVNISFPVDMRGNPTCTTYSIGGTSGAISDCGTGYSEVSAITGSNFSGTQGKRSLSKVVSGTSVNDIIALHFTADAEL